jgi:hypothetical protein
MQLSRFNFASLECGALVQATDAKFAVNALMKQQDLYLLSPCRHFYVEISLCQEIEIDQIMLSNQELFSSSFRDFRVRAAGTEREYTALNTRMPQYFDFSATSKIIRIEFLSHYGKEYYCPVTYIQVFGTPTNKLIQVVPSPTVDMQSQIDLLHSRIRTLFVLVIILFTLVLFK